VSYLGLGHPEEWIVDIHFSFQERRKKCLKVAKDPGMGCSGGGGADDLTGNGEVDADDTILEEPDAVRAGNLSDGSGECPKQEAPRSLRPLDGLDAAHRHSDGNMKHAPGKAVAKFPRKLTLSFGYLA
jgi:hypothetical protein